MGTKRLRGLGRIVEINPSSVTEVVISVKGERRHLFGESRMVATALADLFPRGPAVGQRVRYLCSGAYLLELGPVRRG